MSALPYVGTTTYTVRVNGRPIPQGSMRAYRQPGSDRPALTHANSLALGVWRTSIGERWRQRYPRWELASGGVVLELAFWMARPRGHYRTGRYAALLRDSAPLAPSGAPDLDKLARAVLDALTGVVYRDDGQVVVLHAAKRYADDAPGVSIAVRLR